MKRNVRNLLTALCCTALFAGCSESGSLSVDGFYSTRAGSLAGDRCDALLLEAAEADEADRPEIRDEYRECVEDSIADQGGHAECREDEDPTCEILLDEIGDVVDRLRAERGNQAPDCDAPQTNGDEALCHLMDAYEICQLDHDGDGEPDPDEMPDSACEDVRDRVENAGDDDRDFLRNKFPECFGEDGNHDGEDDANEPDGDRPGEEDGDRPDGDHSENPDDPSGHGSDGDPNDPDRDGEEGWGGGSDGEDPNSPGDGTDDGREGGWGGNGSEDGNGDEFCQALAAEIAVATMNGEDCEDLKEIFNRECTDR